MKNLKFLSELMDVKGAVDTDRIENIIFQDCKIDRGLYIEAYYNPDGVCNEEETSDGGSIFISMDQPISYFALVEILCKYTGCKLKDDELTIRIVNDEKEKADLEFSNITEFVEIKNVTDLVNLKGKIESINKVMALQYLRHFPDSAGVEIGALGDDKITYDDDLDTFLGSINCSINSEVNEDDGTYAHTSVEGMEKGNYLFIHDGENGCYVSFVDMPNRHGKNLGDETFVDFNKCFLVDKEILDKCDDCGRIVPKDILINLTPENNDDLDDLKEEYRDKDGMVCNCCYYHMKK
jgi:hypothetical protein